MWGVYQALHDPEIEEIVVQSSSQVGKTEIILNLIGYFSHQDPSPILVVQPTLENADSFSKERLAPMIRDTPALRSIYPDPKSRESGNTIRKKEFPAGYVQMVGANSPAGLAMRPIRVVLCDETDRYPESAGAEGDVINLAKKRTITFWNRQIVMVSTPTEKGVSRIENAYQGSDQRRYFVTCPHCRHEQILEWRHVQWPKKQPQKAAMTCEDCGAAWSEGERQQAITRAMETGWRPTATPTVPKRAGFKLSELNSMWRTPADIAVDFWEARDTTTKLQTWTNTTLGETFEIPSDVLDDELLYKRREIYPAPVPNGSVLTAGVDVQNDRIELYVVSWGLEEESWSVDYRILEGSPSQRPVWDRLEQELRRVWYRVDNEPMSIAAACIDSGAYTDEVYRFCKRNPRKYIPTKGSSEQGKPVAEFPRTPNAHGVYLTILGPDTIKTITMDQLLLEEPGPGFCHFPRADERKAGGGRGWFDREYFAQLCAEKRERHLVKGRTVYKWALTRHRNEALDCRCNAFAAVRLVQRLGRVSLASLSFLAEPTEPPPKAESQQPTPAAPSSRDNPRRNRRRRGLFDD